MSTFTYYGIEITHFEADPHHDEAEMFRFSVGGWIIEMPTIEEAKSEIKGWVA
jgi:hypothetical protein